VHKAVFTAVQGGEGQRTDQLPLAQLRRAYRARLGIARRALTPRPAFAPFAAFAGPFKPEPLASPKNRDANAEKQSIAHPKQDDPNNRENQNFKNVSHKLASGGPSG